MPAAGATRRNREENHGAAAEVMKIMFEPKRAEWASTKQSKP
jgi:hypothetical protein